MVGLCRVALLIMVKVWKLPLFVVALISSKAFIDYASSGLENALSYFIAALILARLFAIQRGAEGVIAKDLGLLFLLASLAYLNRPDTILLYVPLLVYCSSRAGPWGRGA